MVQDLPTSLTRVKSHHMHCQVITARSALPGQHCQVTTHPHVESVVLVRQALALAVVLARLVRVLDTRRHARLQACVGQALGAGMLMWCSSVLGAWQDAGRLHYPTSDTQTPAAQLESLSSLYPHHYGTFEPVIQCPHIAPTHLVSGPMSWPSTRPSHRVFILTNPTPSPPSLTLRRISVSSAAATFFCSRRSMPARMPRPNISAASAKSTTMCKRGAI